MNKLNIENDLPVNRKLSIWLDEHHYHYHCIPTTTHIWCNCSYVQTMDLIRDGIETEQMSRVALLKT